MKESILQQLDEAEAAQAMWSEGAYRAPDLDMFILKHIRGLIDVARAAQELKTTYVQQPRSLYGDMSKSQSMCNALGALFIQLAKLTPPEEK
jgi:hypothetical protein